jgi:multidrug efflux pump subunit AcrA (membrane-fusion protein)
LLGLNICCTPKIDFSQIITLPVEKKDFLDEVIVSGTLEAVNTRSYGCPGIWSDVTILHLIPEGTQVKPGDTLCILECREIANEYLLAVNELENARAEYNKSLADLNLQFLLLEAQVRTIDASTDIKKLDSLQMEYTSPSDREIIKLELEKAELERNIAQTKLKFLKQINDSELQKMKLKIEQQVNRVDQAKSKLDDLILISDVEGIVIYDKSWITEKKVREGDVIWANLPIIEIPDLSVMQVKLEVSETDYKRLATDQIMKIIVDAFPDIHLSGRIKNKAPVGKPVSEKSDVKIFEVTAFLDSTYLSLQPGLGVTCNVQIKSIPDTLVIPLISLFEEDSLKVVYVADNEKFIKKNVTIADYNNEEVVITSGLKCNEILALRKPPESMIKP